MKQFILNHSFKIYTVILSVITTIIAFTFSASALINDIETNTEDIASCKNDTKTIMKEIKTQINELKHDEILPMKEQVHDLYIHLLNKD